MISYPNAKINLGLNVLAKRDDGFHDIESVFYPVPWRDILEISQEKKGIGQLTFSSSGLEIPTDGSPNLCERVYQLLTDEFSLPSVRVHLHKVVPIGAGLGGGSADAAFTAKMLNEMFSLGIPDTQLEEIVGQVGSDCPFFIRNKPAFVSGRGEVLNPIDLDLSDYWIALVNPTIHIGTAEAYSGIVPKNPTASIKEVVRDDVSGWKEKLQNDFENHLFISHPLIEEIKTELYSAGAEFASMTGSGSTVYGLFKNEPNELNFVNCLVKIGRL